MKLSKRLFVTQVADGWKGVYSPYGHGMALLQEDIWEKLKNSKIEQVEDSVVQYLWNNNILVDHNFETEWLRKNYRFPSIKFNSMYLITSMKCNFACKYCVVEGNVDTPLRFKEVMTPTIASHALDFFQRQLCLTQPNDARLTFYGGEPMLIKR